MKVDQVKVISLDKLELNEGQVPWLRKNPRSWTRSDIDRTKRSLDEDAELMQARPLLAIPYGDKLVVFGGNLRLTAARELGWPGVPVVVFRPEASEIDREAVHRIAIKDNGAFGSWETDELANWNVEPWQLEEWGVSEWVTGGAGKAPTDSHTEPDPADHGPAKLEIEMSPEELIFVKDALSAYGDNDREAILNLLNYGQDEV